MGYGDAQWAYGGSGSGSSGVSSINSLTGSVDITAGTGISVSVSGQDVVITNSEPNLITSVSNSDGTLTISPTTGTVVASLALGHANTWTANQTFSAEIISTQTNGNPVLLNTATAPNFYISGYGNWVYVNPTTSNYFAIESTTSVGGSTTPVFKLYPSNGNIEFSGTMTANGITYTWPSAETANYFLQTDGSGNLSWVSGTASGVSSVSNSDGTLTISPTTGAVVASLNTGHANTWTTEEIFENVFVQNLYSVWFSDYPQAVGSTAGYITGTAATSSASGYLAFANSPANSSSPDPHFWVGYDNPTSTVSNTAVSTYNNTLDDGSGNLTTSGTVNGVKTVITSVATGHYLYYNGTNWVNITPIVGSTLIEISGQIGLNLGNANAWTAAQDFTAVTSTSGIKSNVKSKTSAYTLTTTDEFISASASSAALTITLPSATGSGQKYLILKSDSSANAVTLAAAGTDTIEGSATKVISSQYGKVGVIDIASGLWADLGTGGGI